MRQRLFIALLSLGVCFASGSARSAQALQAEPRSPPSSSCAPCPELELLGRTVIATCAIPAVATLPEMAAACALAATLHRPKEQAELPEGLLPAVSHRSNHTSETIESGLRVSLQPAQADPEGEGDSKSPLVTVVNEKAMPVRTKRYSSIRHKDRPGRQHARMNSNALKRHHRAASSSPCPVSSIGLLQGQCAVSGCDYNYDYNYETSDGIIFMECHDATAIAFSPVNRTACSLLAQLCSMEIDIYLPPRPERPGLLKNAALLIDMWQTDVTVLLYDQWSEEELSAVLKHGHNVSYLDVSEAGLTSISSTTFAKLTSLQTLALQRNNIRNIATGAFSALTKLESLDLNNNELEALPSKLFCKCPLLTDLDLSVNNLKYLAVSQFNGIQALEKLNLSRNHIPALAADIFQGMSHLTTLDIGNNQLAAADVSLFVHLSVLETLRLSYNPLDVGSLVLPNLSPLAELWLESTGISELHLLSANTTITYLTVADSDRLTSISLAPGTGVAQADVSGTALRIDNLPCTSFGYKGLVARKMQDMTALDLLKECMGADRLFLDVSDNDERRVEAVRQSLSSEAASFLMGDVSWGFIADAGLVDARQVPVRNFPVSLTLVASPVQCSTHMAESYVRSAGSYTYKLMPLQMFSCKCIPGYVERNGVCHKVIPFVATAGGVATIVVCVAAVALMLGYGPVRRRLHHAHHDLEMQRGLLEYAETEVLALKRVWEIEADEVKLVRRIDGDSEGAFGAVWRGDWDGMVVAVKVLRAGLLELDSSFADEFDREADFLMRARHANVVRFFGAGRMPGGEPFVVLELVSRGSLRGLLRGDKGSQLDDALKQRLALDVARGMAYIHSLGALHRDLKSGNVLVTENWRGKVADFGSMRTLLASAAAGSGSGRAGGAGSSISGTVSSAACSAREQTLTAGVGTPLYMSLEVLRGDEYGEAADVWAFGVVVWELVEQRSPDLLLETGDQGRGPLLGRLLKLLEAGKRLQLGAEAPGWAQRVATECVLAEAGERPSFAVLKDRLATMAEGTESTEAVQ